MKKKMAKTTMCTRTLLLLATIQALVCACDQNPGITPEILRVFPELIGNQGERHLIIEGNDFSPVVSWPAAGGELHLNQEFMVSIDEYEPIEATVLSDHRLVVRVPEGLAAGRHSVTVVAPTGRQASLADAFCVDDQPELELVYTCTVNELDLCASPIEGGSRRLLVEDTIAGVWEGAGNNQTDTLDRGYDLSPDGKNIAFLRIGETESGIFSHIVLSHIEEGWETILIEAIYPPDASEDFRLLSTPVFSPDGTLLAYVRNRTELLVQAVPTSPEVVTEPQVIHSESAPLQGQAHLMYPDFDPGARYLLFTRVIDIDPENWTDDLVSLHLAPLNGDPVFKLLQPISGQTFSKDGPGAFLPAGDKVLFMSDRSFLNIPTPFGSMAPAIRLYTIELSSGRIETLGMTTAAYLYGKPEISPNGRLVASAGFMADLSGSGLDTIITDMRSGLMSRAGVDPVDNCFPADSTENCKRPNNELDYSLPCCADPENAGTCCYLNLGACPTWNQAPAFSPDSGLLVANTVSLEWRCEKDAEDPDVFRWLMYLRHFFLSLSVVTSEGVVWEETSLTTGLYNLPSAPLVREVLDCPQGQ